MKKNFWILCTILCSVCGRAQKANLVLPQGHTKLIESLDLSPNGKYILTGSSDNTSKLWETKSGKLVFTFEGHTSRFINRAIFSPDGKYIVTFGDETVKIWDPVTGKLVRNLQGHKENVSSVEFSPDGKLLSTASCDKTAKIWEVNTWRLLRTLPGHKSCVGSAVFSPNGKYLVTTSDDATAKLWDVASGHHIYDLKGHRGFLTSAAFSPDSKYVVTAAADSSARIWTVRTGKLFKKLTGNFKIDSANFFFGSPMAATVSNVSVSPNGKYVLTTSYDNAAKLWDLFSGRLLWSLDHNKTGETSFFSKDGKYIVTSSADSSVKIWETETGRLLKTLNGNEYDVHNTIRISPDGRKLLMASANMKITLFDFTEAPLIKNKKTYNVKGDLAPLAATFSADGKSVFTNNGGRETVWNLAAGKPVINLGDGRKFDQIAFSKDRQNIATLIQDTLQIWDVSSGQPIRTVFISLSEKWKTWTRFSNTLRYVVADSFKRVFRPRSFGDTTAPDVIDQSYLNVWDIVKGRQLYPSINGNFMGFSADDSIMLTSQDTVLGIWQASTGKQMGSLTLNGPFHKALFSPDKKFVAVEINDFNGTGFIDVIQTWDWRANKMLFKKSGAGLLDLSPDGNYVLMDDGGTVEIYQVATGRRQLSLKGHKAEVIKVRYSANGKYILSSSGDYTAKVWNATTGKKVFNLAGHKNEVNSAEFSKDGNYILTVSTDNTAKIWETQRGRLLYTLVPVGDKDYLVLDSVNRYDGTSDARNLLYFVCGNEIVDLEQFKELSWEPGLVGKIMGISKEPITAKKLSEIDICNLTPKVEESRISKGRFIFYITPRRGGLGEVVLFVNGKQIKSYLSTELTKEGNSYQLAIDSNVVSKYFVSSQENRVEAMAYSADNTVKSRRGEIIVTGEDDEPVDINLYAISVGVSNYKGEKLSLAYASKDAESFSRILQASAKKLLNSDDNNRVFIYTFSTHAGYAWPAKTSIRKAFEEIALRATPNDIVVVFLAGHGVLRGMDKQFYFLTQEASALTIGGVEKEVAISTQELNDWMLNIKAQKQILILDACNSGEVVSDVHRVLAKREMPADQQRALERLKDRTGTFILSASASEQAAYESSLYEQGLLTYSLLSGIKYGGGLKDNKFIDVSRWFNYAADQVRLLAKDIGGRQEPQIIGNASFDVGIVDKEVLDSIQLTAKKKIFKRSRFYEADDPLSDELELSMLVDKELNELSARGTESPLVYIDDSRTEQAYTIRGSYTVTGEQMRIDVSLFIGPKERLYRFQIEGTTSKKQDTVNEIVQKVKAFAGQQ